MIECDLCQGEAAMLQLTTTDLQGVVIDRKRLCLSCWETAAVRDASELGHGLLNDYRKAAGIPAGERPAV